MKTKASEDTDGKAYCVTRGGRNDEDPDLASKMLTGCKKVATLINRWDVNSMYHLRVGTSHGVHVLRAD